MQTEQDALSTILDLYEAGNTNALHDLVWEAEEYLNDV